MKIIAMAILFAILQCFGLLFGILSSHADGKTLYEQKCLACHGSDVLRREPEVLHELPPRAGSAEAVHRDQRPARADPAVPTLPGGRRD